MIKVNLLRDHASPVEKKKSGGAKSQTSPAGLLYIVGAIAAVAISGYLWVDSGNTLKNATAEKQRLEREVKAMEDMRRLLQELEQKKQERQSRISTIEGLLESQKGPVILLNTVIQAIPQNRDLWLTLLEQTNTGVKVSGETRVPEAVPDFMDNLRNSGIFSSIDIEQLERRPADEISTFSILCAGGR